MQIVPRCTAFSKTTGKQCRQPAIRGGTVCIVHGGASPAAKAEARRRIATLVDPALEVMYELLTDKKTPAAVRKEVAKDILDRAGFKPIDKHEHLFPWDGDIAKLNDDALERLVYYMERLAFGEDRARILQEKRQTLLDAGAALDIVDAEFQEVATGVPQDNDPQEPAVEDDDGW